MYHRTRWTPEKIKQRLELISPLVYIKRKSLPSFHYRELDRAIAFPYIGAEVNNSQWQEVGVNEYWGSWMQNFILRTTFTIIVRLYESQRKRWLVQLRVGFAVEAAWETNLLEENESALSVENDSIQLSLRPYQIMTIRLKEKS